MLVRSDQGSYALVGGDKTVLDCTFQGTHDEEFMGIPATARPCDVRAIVISRFHDGQIVEEWEIIDTMTMMGQLGAV